MAPRNDKLKQTVQEDKKRLLLRARKWPYANILTGAAAAALGLAGFALSGGGVMGIVFGLIGAGAGGALQKLFQGVERTISLKLYDLASRIEIVEQTDVKDKTGAIPNSLLDEFTLVYHGGHPSWKAEKAEYGTLQVYERSIVFKNLRNRLRMPMARLNKVTLETFVQVRVRKIPEVVVPEVKASKNKVLAKIREFIRRKQRFVVLDYTDDTGSQRLVVFWPTAGNPRFAKQVKEVLDGAIRKAAKDRQARAEAAGPADSAGQAGAAPGGSGPLVPVRRPTIVGKLPSATMSGMRGGLAEVSQDAIEAAKRASQAQLGTGDQGLTLTTIMREAAQAKPCPYCKFSLKDPLVTCSLCAVEHHEGCWKANFGCTTKDCRGKAVKKADPAAAEAAAAAPAGSGAPAAATPEATTAAADGRAPASGSLFQVVLASAGGTEQEREAVANQMASLFNIPVDKVRIVLQKVPSIAKRNLNRSEAESLAQRFRAIGADAQVEEMKG